MLIGLASFLCYDYLTYFSNHIKYIKHLAFRKKENTSRRLEILIIESKVVCLQNSKYLLIFFVHFLDYCYHIFKKEFIYER